MTIVYKPFGRLIFALFTGVPCKSSVTKTFIYLKVVIPFVMVMDEEICIDDYVLFPKGSVVDLALRIEEDDKVRRRIILAVKSDSKRADIHLRGVGHYGGIDSAVMGGELAVIQSILKVPNKNKLLYRFLDWEQIYKYNNDDFSYMGSDIIKTMRRMAVFIDLIAGNHTINKLGRGNFNPALHEMVKSCLSNSSGVLPLEGYRISDSYLNLR